MATPRPDRSPPSRKPTPAAPSPTSASPTTACSSSPRPGPPPPPPAKPRPPKAWSAARTPYWTSYTLRHRRQPHQPDTSHAAGGRHHPHLHLPRPRRPPPARRHPGPPPARRTGTSSYGYDNAGNTTTRNIAGKPGQTLTWDAEGPPRHPHRQQQHHQLPLRRRRQPAHRPRHHRRPPSTSAAPNSTAPPPARSPCTRYYATAAHIAVRTDPGTFTWLAADHHGTGELAIDATTLAATRRKTDPFGNPRGTTPTWPSTHGFVNGAHRPHRPHPPRRPRIRPHHRPVHLRRPHPRCRRPASDERLRLRQQQPRHHQRPRRTDITRHLPRSLRQPRRPSQPSPHPSRQTSRPTATTWRMQLRLGPLVRTTQSITWRRWPDS